MKIRNLHFRKTDNLVISFIRWTNSVVGRYAPKSHGCGVPAICNYGCPFTLRYYRDFHIFFYVCPHLYQCRRSVWRK